MSGSFPYNSQDIGPQPSNAPYFLGKEVNFNYFLFSFDESTKY